MISATPCLRRVWGQAPLNVRPKERGFLQHQSVPLSPMGFEVQGETPGLGSVREGATSVGTHRRLHSDVPPLLKRLGLKARLGRRLSWARLKEFSFLLSLSELTRCCGVINGSQPQQHLFIFLSLDDPCRQNRFAGPRGRLRLRGTDRRTDGLTGVPSQGSAGKSAGHTLSCHLASAHHCPPS